MKQTLEWHPESCHDQQQSFDQYLHVHWPLCLRPCSSWSRRRLRKTPWQGLRPHSFCTARWSEETFTSLGLYGVFLNYTTITNLLPKSQCLTLIKYSLHSYSCSEALTPTNIENIAYKPLQIIIEKTWLPSLQSKTYIVTRPLKGKMHEHIYNI